jgi:arsenite methyltransferase
MALTCPVDLDVATLRNEIQTMYGRVASAPDAEFHFHRGPEYAASRLGYDHNELAQLPVAVTAAFAGVGNPHAMSPMDRDSVVLDIGCGAGMDLLLAARRIRPNGRAVGSI